MKEEDVLEAGLVGYGGDVDYVGRTRGRPRNSEVYMRVRKDMVCRGETNVLGSAGSGSVQK